MDPEYFIPLYILYYIERQTFLLYMEKTEEINTFSLKVTPFLYNIWHQVLYWIIYSSSFSTTVFFSYGDLWHHIIVVVSVTLSE